MDREEYLELVTNMILTNLPANQDEGLQAAKVGQLIRRALPSQDFRDFGFNKLQEVLAALAEKGRIFLGNDKKGALSVWRSRPTSATSLRIGGTNIDVPLTKPAWDAFVVEFPKGLRFCNRHTGEIRLALEVAPAPEADWALINAVSADTQRGWAVEFLTKHNLSNNRILLASLDARTWYTEFPAALSALDASHASLWNRTRSQLVAHHVEAWCKANAVPTEHVFRPASTNIDSNSETTWDGTEVRALLLKAIEGMTTDELLNLPIPPHRMLDAFSKLAGR